jgi:hypothetical protein
MLLNGLKEEVQKAQKALERWQFIDISDKVSCVPFKIQILDITSPVWCKN